MSALIRASDSPVAARGVACQGDAEVEREVLMDFPSGYVQRAMDRMPKQGSKSPWRLHQNYARDILTLRFGSLQDSTMVFSRGAQSKPTPQETLSEAS